MMTSRRRIVGLSMFGGLLILAAAFIWWFVFSESMNIDRCLDLGGAWRYGTCRLEPASE